jgi:hypothetical protein
LLLRIERVRGRWLWCEHLKNKTSAWLLEESIVLGIIDAEAKRKKAE